MHVRPYYKHISYADMERLKLGKYIFFLRLSLDFVNNYNSFYIIIFLVAYTLLIIAN